MDLSILSMEVDDDNENESEYRIRIGHKVKYLKIAAATFDRDTLSFPLASLPLPPYSDDNWNVAHISRDIGSGELRTLLSQQQLAGVQNVWHSTQVDILDLERAERLTAATFEAVVCKKTDSNTKRAITLPLRPKLIAKIARFEWEIPRVERETRAYQLLQQKDPALAPRFLGHIREGDRVIGLLLEKLEDRRTAAIHDLHGCEMVLERFHNLGLLHGDVNRHNFLVDNDGVKLIDFEHSQEHATEISRTLEMQNLRVELDDLSGRGAGFVLMS
ncbi:alpha-galactosidase A [Lizonia empirigonia]|nr:alpha-galactosidase A [Lizonia empirigonia]